MARSNGRTPGDPAAADTPAPRVKVALACQGGGSHTAFTAGVLARILDDPAFQRHCELVAISGTSGGAVCGLLGWYGLLTPGPGRSGGARAAALLQSFWDANAATELWDRYWANPLLVGTRRLVEAGWLPAGPALPGLPALVRQHLQSLLEAHVPFADLPTLLAGRPEQPTLLCGAVELLSGRFTVFEQTCPDPDWRRSTPEAHPPATSVATVLASAAVPPLLPAIEIGPHRYWDGLYAHNPPVRALVDRIPVLRPDEIWVIQIDPETIPREPVTAAAIADRRFALSSNLSLNAELHWIRQINQWLERGVLHEPDFKYIRVARIAITPALADSLDVASKVDRDPGLLGRLRADGTARAAAFLADRFAGDDAGPGSTTPGRGPGTASPGDGAGTGWGVPAGAANGSAWWEPLFPHGPAGADQPPAAGTRRR